MRTAPRLFRWLGHFVPRANVPKVLVDSALLALCYPIAHMLRLSGSMPGRWPMAVLVTTAMLVPIKVALLAAFGQYRAIWRYASIRELTGLLKAAGIGFAAALALTNLFQLERSVAALLIDFLLTVMLLGGVRMASRVRTARRDEAGGLRRFLGSDDLPDSAAHRRRVLIYGAGDAGEILAREMSRPRLASLFEAIGFIDDDPAKHGLSIHNVPVLGGRDVVPSIVRTRQVDEIVITIPSARGRVVRELVHSCEGSGAQLKIVPALDEIVDGKVQVSDMRGLKLEDLLGRERVDLNVEAISSYLRGKRVLVTGAGGSIGSELCRQIVRFRPSELLLFGRGENSIFKIHEELTRGNVPVTLWQIIGDVINRKKLDGIFRAHAPQIVFHAGADKHVPLMELNPDEAVLNNVLGTMNLLEVAGEHRAERVVCISTDKAVNPSSVMGCCKRIAELLVQRRRYGDTITVAVRFGNVLGSRGSVVPVFQSQIDRGGPVTVTHPDVRRFFMTITEASQLVIQAGALGSQGDLFILDMGEPVRILDLAMDMIRLAGYEPEIDIPIRFTGMRPGDKLFEDLLLPAESCEATAHEKILRIRPDSGPAPEDLTRDIQALTDLAVTMDFGGILVKLKEIIPEFMPERPRSSPPDRESVASTDARRAEGRDVRGPERDRTS